MNEIVQNLNNLSLDEISHRARLLSEEIYFKGNKIKSFQNIIQLMRTINDDEKEKQFEEQMDSTVNEIKTLVLILSAHWMSSYYRKLLNFDEKEVPYL